MSERTVRITDKYDVNCGKEFPGWLAYHDLYHRGGTNQPIEDLYLVTIDGNERRYVSSQIEEHYREQILKEEIKNLGAKVGDKVRVLKETSGSYGKQYYDRKSKNGFHTITKIECYGHVTFDNGEAEMFRPTVEVINE